MAGTTCHWACGTGAMKGTGITPELKALTFPRHGHSLVGTRSAGSGNHPGYYGSSQIQSSCGCPVHTHPGLGGESRAVESPCDVGTQPGPLPPGWRPGSQIPCGLRAWLTVQPHHTAAAGPDHAGFSGSQNKVQGAHCTASATTNGDATWCWTNSQDPQPPTEGRAAHLPSPCLRHSFPQDTQGQGELATETHRSVTAQQGHPGFKSKASLEGESGPLPWLPFLAVLAGPKFCGQWH